MEPLPLEEKQTESLFGRVEKWMLVLLLGILIGFSLLQIILRNFFATGFVWGDSLLRNLVLWISFLGAARATAEDKHIRIDLLPRLLPGSAKAVLNLLVDSISFLVCLALLYAAFSFIGYEKMEGSFVFNQIPLWWLEIVFPLSFALMAVRFGLRIPSGILHLLGRNKDHTA
jgi:TRAP-type C4-dicarboxylate transport system permease small subunit